jgi:ribonuclease J
LKLMIHMVKPKFFIPIHGDYRHLKRHAGLALDLGTQAILIEDGDVLEMDANSMRKNGKVTAGRVCIDSGSTSDIVDDIVIRERKHISESGIVLPIIAINKNTGRVEQPPEIVTRGFAAAEEGLIKQAQQIVTNTLEASTPEEKADYGVIKEKIRQDLKRYIQKNTSRRPLIMPVILEL